MQKTESPFNLFGGESQRQGTATGSGIVIDSNGTILTNYHVVENAVKVTVSFEKGKTVEAQVVGKDPSNDLAVLRIHPDGLTLHPLTLGDSSAVQVGDPVFAIGNPFDLERTLTTGVISALQRADHGAQRLHDRQRAADRRADQPRQLGRPAARRRRAGDRHQLPDRDRRQRRRQRRHRLRGADQHRQVARSPSWRRAARSRGAYLGLTSLTIDGSLSALNLPVKSGALVQSVQKGTAAAKAGIRGGTISTSVENGQVAVGGDIIVAVDGKAIASSEDLANDIDDQETRADGHDPPGARQRPWRLRTEDRQRHARQPAELGSQPEHARRLGGRRGPAGRRAYRYR